MTAGAISLAAVLLAAPAHAATGVATLFRFNNSPADGSRPQGSDILDFDGALWVATPFGVQQPNDQRQFGGVFQLKPKTGMNELVGPHYEAAEFLAGSSETAQPQDLTFFTTYLNGGTVYDFFTTVTNEYNSGPGLPKGEIDLTTVSPNNVISSYSVHSFADTPTDPGLPTGRLVQGPFVFFPETGQSQQTYFGMADDNGMGDANAGCGAIYALTSPLYFSLNEVMAWTPSVMHSFTGGPTGADGCLPTSLVGDTDGTLYGTTWSGGATGTGTVFSISITQGINVPVFTTLYSFQTTRPDGSNDGANPTSGLIVGKDGNLYGTTQNGGLGLGSVFELVRPQPGQTAWTEIALHDFTGSSTPLIGPAPDGAFPKTGVVQDGTGALYGVTYEGGITQNPYNTTQPGLGAIFSLKPPTKKSAKWTEALVHLFNGKDGAYPLTTPQVLAVAGKTQLMGTTSFDTVQAGGTVYRFHY